MKKLAVLLLVSLVSILMFSTTALAQVPAVNQADVDAIEKARTEIQAFTDIIISEAPTDEEIKAQAIITQSALEAVSARGFFVAAFGSAYTAAGAKIRAAADDLRTDVVEAGGLLITAEGNSPVITSYDQDSYQAFVSRYNSHLDALDRALADFNTAVDAGNEKVEDKKDNDNKLMLIPFIASILLSVALYLWAHTKRQIDGRLREARKGMFSGSVVLCVGLGITALTFVFADKLGGRYVISYGFIIAGAVVFIRSIVSYLKTKKTQKA